MTDSPPDVFSYLDHRAFLRDWFAWKQDANPRYSHRAFARQAGVRSPSLLLLVIQGKRNLTDNTLPGFEKALRLDKEERGFFRLLVELERAGTVEERNKVWQKVSATSRFRQARRLEADAFRYLTCWYLPAIRELAAAPDFRLDASWIASVMRPKIRESEAQDAIETLLHLGLWEKDGEGVRRVDKSVVTPHEVTRLAVINYHQGMLQRASECIERFGPESRHLGAVTAAVPGWLVPQLKAELVAFQERILDLCDGAEGAADQVYQVNLNLFPLTAPAGEA